MNKGASHSTDSAHGALLTMFTTLGRELRKAVKAAPRYQSNLEEGMVAFDTAIANGVAKDFEPSRVDVIDTVVDLAPGPVTEAFRAGSEFLPWTPSFRGTDEGTEIALATANDAFDIGGTRIGFVYVGPGQAYPEHQHRPQEMYLTVAGDGEWLHGGNTHYETLKPGRAIYNRPEDLHGVRSVAKPLVALYVLWDFD